MSTSHSAMLTIPSTQNTALVVEFQCLYTHDLRRKSKRWQDGILRFHTFNKRIMVYDSLRNFVGDCHWRNNSHLASGDELELESGGALVQVEEVTGSTEQDLTGLFGRKHGGDGQRGQDASSNATPLQQLLPTTRDFSTLRSITMEPSSPLFRQHQTPMTQTMRKTGQVSPRNNSPVATRRPGVGIEPSTRSLKRARSTSKALQGLDDQAQAKPLCPGTAGAGRRVEDLAGCRAPKSRAVDVVEVSGVETTSVIADREDARRRRTIGIIGPEKTTQDHICERLSQSSLSSLNLRGPETTLHQLAAQEDSVDNNGGVHKTTKITKSLLVARASPRKKFVCGALNSTPRYTNPHTVQKDQSPSQSPRSRRLDRFHRAQRERIQDRLKTAERLGTSGFLESSQLERDDAGVDDVGQQYPSARPPTGVSSQSADQKTDTDYGSGILSVGDSTFMANKNSSTLHRNAPAGMSPQLPALYQAKSRNHKDTQRRSPKLGRRQQPIGRSPLIVENEAICDSGPRSIPADVAATLTEPPATLLKGNTSAYETAEDDDIIEPWTNEAADLWTWCPD